MFNPANEKNVSKHHSRYRVARSINSDGNTEKVIHYLGGVSSETHFENFFSKQNTTFFRYEREECETPKNYSDGWLWSLVENEGKTSLKAELSERTPDQFGYFLSGDFFFEVKRIMQIPEFNTKRNYFWLDFCSTPKEELLNQLNDFLKSYNEYAEEIYFTFFLNARNGKEFISNAINRYDKTIEGRAKSVCDTLKEKLSIDNYSVSILDTYVNGRSPMAVIKLKRKKHMKKTKTATATAKPAVNRNICNTQNYALMRDKGFTNAEIEALWGMPRQAIAAFQAWNTMGGKTWNDQEQDLNTIHLGRRVCRNTFIPDTEDNKI